MEYTTSNSHRSKCRNSKNHITYLTDSGPVDGEQLEIPANSRSTVTVSDELPGRDTSVKVTCSLPVMAERSMYWNSKGAGHASIGWVP